VRGSRARRCGESAEAESGSSIPVYRKRPVSAVFREGPEPVILKEWQLPEMRKSCWPDRDSNGDIARSRSGAK
jgi:hypothetical protein